MPRIGRKNLNTCYFHLIVQGINKEYIFDNEQLKKRYQYLIYLNIKKYKLNLIAYCIMSNHAHILMYTNEINQISRFMQSVNTSFSKYYNGYKNRVGIVFRSRYKSEPIYNNKHLSNCMVYIHNNPVKAKMVKMPGEYKYSSYNDYISKTIDKQIVNYSLGINKDFLNTFANMHNNADSFQFEDYIEDINYDEEIKKILTKNIGEIILNEGLLKNVVSDLIINHKIPIKKVCEIFKLSRYKISRLLNNKKNDSIIKYKK